MDKNKVLVVDDESYIRLLVRSILGRDYDVVEAENGEEVVKLARTEGPSLILMDIMMPKMDGVGACSLLKADSVTKDIPVVMVSARGDKLDQDYAMQMGADGYITKPFMSQELLEIVVACSVTSVWYSYTCPSTKIVPITNVTAYQRRRPNTSPRSAANTPYWHVNDEATRMIVFTSAYGTSSSVGRRKSVV